MRTSAQSSRRYNYFCSAEVELSPPESRNLGGQGRAVQLGSQVGMQDQLLHCGVPARAASPAEPEHGDRAVRGRPGQAGVQSPSFPSAV